MKTTLTRKQPAWQPSGVKAALEADLRDALERILGSAEVPAPPPFSPPVHYAVPADYHAPVLEDGLPCLSPHCEWVQFLRLWGVAPWLLPSWRDHRCVVCTRIADGTLRRSEITISPARVAEVPPPLYK